MEREGLIAQIRNVILLDPKLRVLLQGACKEKNLISVHQKSTPSKFAKVAEKETNKNNQSRNYHELLIYG